ncbi:MAG TPA: hypothetical protein P5022_03700, partial [Candidatus Paceibacterota bacterium]|nr:hypothetical protein [Candidatus Paceibacterota bacterium]
RLLAGEPLAPGERHLLVCAHGVRSHAAAEMLRARGVTRVYSLSGGIAAFAAHIGDASLRGRELWIAMTSRPDLLAIDMKRQGRFGLSIPLFPAQNADEVLELFTVIARVQRVKLTSAMKQQLRSRIGDRPLTGSDVESILIRARERAVLDRRDDRIQIGDFEEAIDSFVDPLDPNLLALQELAAVLSCSDRRYLPARYRDAERAALVDEFHRRKLQLARR